MVKRLVNEKFSYITGVSYTTQYRNPLRISNKNVINNLILVHSYIISKVKYDEDLEKYLCKWTYSELIDYTGLSKKQVERALAKLIEYEIVAKVYRARSKNESSILEYILWKIGGLNE